MLSNEEDETNVQTKEETNLKVSLSSRCQRVKVNQNLKILLDIGRYSNFD